MQNETVRGNTPAPASGAVAPDVRLCLACLHENRGGEQSCEVCGTSLYLILCGACEAVNGPGALRCHSCGAALGAEASGKAAAALPGVHTPLTRVEASDKPAAAPAASRASLARTDASDKRAATPPAKRLNRARLALILAALVAVAAFAYQYQYVPRIAPAERSHEGRIVQPAPVEPSEPPARVQTPTKPPARTKAPSKPPASAASVPKAAQPHARVTHTRPGDSSSTPPAAAVVVPAAPAAGQTSEARCSEEVIALGLCNTSATKGR